MAVTDGPEEVGADALGEHMAGTARRLAASAGLDDLLQRIADLGEAELDGCDGVSLMLVVRGGGISTPAYSSTVARDSDWAQHETGEGPCLEALREHETIVIDDLETEERWPAYRERALALGVRSLIGFRLFVEADTMGALDFYSATPHAFGRRAGLQGQIFASHAAVALKAAVTEAGLERAIESRDVIGQAKGVIMVREALDAEAAFDRLRQRSQQLNRPLRDLAEAVARTGELP